MIKVVGLERTKGMARLRFRAGSRVLKTLGRLLSAEAALNEVAMMDCANSVIGCCNRQKRPTLSFLD